jgi:hypothetical protein
MGKRITHRAGWLLIVIGAIPVALLAQDARPRSAGAGPARRVMDPARLSASEVMAVLQESRQRASGKPFRIAVGLTRIGSEVLLEHGRLRFLREIDGLTGAAPTLTEYTGERAIRCDGTMLDGERVVEYSDASGVWAAKVRPSNPVEAPSVYALLALLADSGLNDGGLATDGASRAFRGSWRPSSFEVVERQ